MIAGILLRHYKNYGNLKFVPICDNTQYMYSVYVGNNGVGKSAILEALDVVFNERIWNVTFNMKKLEAFICPLFLIEKNKIATSKRGLIEVVSNFFWNVDESLNPNIKGNKELQNFLKYKESLKERYEKTHYLILVGISYENLKGAYCATFQGGVQKEIATKLLKNEDELDNSLMEVKRIVYDLYSYLYIPVEESPKELLKLQNSTMQQLLNKNILSEIEKILNKKTSGKSIVTLINDNLDEFIEEVNGIISSIDKKYSFTNDVGNKKNLTAKDIREKILEAYFPLRALKANGHRVEQLSSGEQRKAIIDVAYSILMANGERKTEKEIVLAIDEPETSMHISNCFNQFLRLEELAGRHQRQIMLTTHWYGFLPIAQNGKMHHIVSDDLGVTIDTFSLYNVLEERRNFPSVIELKSMYDLATSIITYMRAKPETTWIVCEGSDDKVYLEYVMRKYNNLSILPVGGCGNVVKLFQLLYSPLTEKAEEKDGKALFLIDTDLQYKSVKKPIEFSNNSGAKVFLRRLQIDKDEIKLLDPCKSNVYSQTEMEDCLDPKCYYEAVMKCISNSNNNKLKSIAKKYKFVDTAAVSVLRGDNSCICATDCKVITEKSKIIEFAENPTNKYEIANIYKSVCEQSDGVIEHKLEKSISDLLEIAK